MNVLSGIGLYLGITYLLLFLGGCSNTQLSEAPDWYLEPPEDKKNIYASGYASDSNLQFAKDVAVLSAKRTLASYINSSISGKAKYYRGASGKNLSEIAAIDRIDQVKLNGYVQRKIDVTEDDGQYRIYILLAYPLSNVSEEPRIFKEIE